MKAENIKSKIKKIYNQETTNDYDITKFEASTRFTHDAIRNTEIAANLKQQIKDLSTDWLDMEIFSVEQFDDTNLIAMYKEIRIPLPDMLFKFLAFINIEIIYKAEDIISSVFSKDSSLFDDRVRRSYFFEVKNIEGNTAKNITLVIGVSVSRTQVVQYQVFPMQIKALINLANEESIL